MAFKELIDSAWYNLSKIFVPTSVIGGLQITDSSIRYMELRAADGSAQIVVNKSLRLPPGLLEDGKVKDRAGFLAALKFLKHQVTLNSKRKLNVALTIPTGDVYVQAFSIPKLSGAALDEAIKLNLLVISPNPIDKTYYSWKVVGGEIRAENQMEILGVFALRDVIDGLSSVVEEAGFGIAAIEFSSLSLVRILNSYKLIQKNLSYLLIKLTQDGLIFMILKNGELYFNYFHSWDKVAYETAGISVASVLEIIKAESQRVLNFYYSHWGGQVSNIILITGVLTPQISNFIKSEYPDFALTVVDSSKDNLHGARGAALRGLIPRIQDEDINLMGEKVINAFWRDQVFNFIGIWRNTILIVMGFMLVVFIASDFFLIKEYKGIKEVAAVNLQRPETTELAALKTQVAEFNGLVKAVSAAKSLKSDVAPFITKVNSIAAQSGVTISRFGLRTVGLDVNLSGIAPTQDKIIDFKNKIAALPEVYEVDLPLSAIAPNPSGGFSFNTTFKIRALKGF